MIKAIIFDCFGVLAEDGWMPIKRKYVGSNVELAEQISDLGKQNEYGLIDNESHLVKMADLIGIDSEILRVSLNKKVPNEDLFEYITTKLKPHYKVGLMSNANFNVLRDLFTPDQAHVFDASVMSFESRLIKPDVRMYKLIAGRLGVEIQECVFIDDQERYCYSAESYGMQGIWYKSNDQLIHDLSDILSA